MRDRSAEEVTYRCRIDDQDPVTFTRAEHSHEDELEGLGFLSDDFTVYWDDVVVRRGVSGSGDSEDLGEEIEDWHDLNSIRHNLDGDYVLVDNLDETTPGYDEHVGTPENGWDPIGGWNVTEDVEFTGTFDGNGHFISGLRIDRPNEEFVGLFSGLRGSVVTHITLIDPIITGGSAVGALVGGNDDSVVMKASAIGRVSGDGGVGGLVGASNNGVVAESWATSAVTGENLVGGLVGVNERGECEISESWAGGSVTGGERAGGLIGANSEGIIKESWADVEVEGENLVGGLVGANFDELRDSYWNERTSGQTEGIGDGDGSVTGLSTAEMQGESARNTMSALEFEETWVIQTNPDDYPKLAWQAETPGDPDESTGLPDESADTEIQLEDASVVATVTMNGEDFHVLQDLPDEPPERYAYVNDQFQLVDPNTAFNVAISYEFCETYRIDNERRLEVANQQHDEYGDLEAMARAANLLSDLSGVLALAKISPLSAATNAIESVQTAIDWQQRDLNDAYHEQFVKMAATGDTINWADDHLSEPDGTLMDVTDDALDVTQTLLGLGKVVDAGLTLGESAGTVREIIRTADTIRTDVDPSLVDGVSDLRRASFTLVVGLAVDATVDSVSGVADGQTRAAAIGKSQTAARRPLLNELVDLQKRAAEYNLGPAGALRIHSLMQSEYQIEAAALYAQADIIEEYQSSRLGRIISSINGTEDTPEKARDAAGVYQDLSHFRTAVTGQAFDLAMNEYDRSLNAEELGPQTVLEES